MAGHELLCAAEWDLLELPETVIRRPPDDPVDVDDVCVALLSASFGGKKFPGRDESTVVRRSGVDVVSPVGDRPRFRSGLFSSGSSFLMTVGTLR